MNSIPPAILSVIQFHLNTLLYWFSDEMYRRLLGRAQNHFLVRLTAQLDFAPLEQACAGYHHHSGPGAPVVHSVPRLVRALLVKYLLDLSLRQVEHEIRYNLLVKRFVGYAVFEAGPDHATLERFEQWVYSHHPRSFFDEILRQIDWDFPEERQKAQIGDTYALRANAASESLIQLLRHSCQRLLRTWEEACGESLALLEGELALDAIFGAEKETKEFRLDAGQRKQRLHHTVVAALRCQTLIRSRLADHPRLSEGQRQAVEPWLSILDKILTDEVAISRDEQGQVTAVRELPKAKKGSYRIAGATDPDATFRVHGERIDFGYNVNVATTDSFIREIRADTPAASPTPSPFLTSSPPSKNITTSPRKSSSTSRLPAQARPTPMWRKPRAGAPNSVAPLANYAQRSERLSPDDFTLDCDDASLTCPNDQVSAIAYRSQSGEGRVFRFSPAPSAPAVPWPRPVAATSSLPTACVRSSLAITAPYWLKPAPTPRRMTS